MIESADQRELNVTLQEKYEDIMRFVLPWAVSHRRILAIGKILMHGKTAPLKLSAAYALRQALAHCDKVNDLSMNAQLLDLQCHLRHGLAATDTRQMKSPSFLALYTEVYRMVIFAICLGIKSGNMKKEGSRFIACRKTLKEAFQQFCDMAADQYHSIRDQIKFNCYLVHQLLESDMCASDTTDETISYISTQLMFHKGKSTKDIDQSNACIQERFEKLSGIGKVLILHHITTIIHSNNNLVTTCRMLLNSLVRFATKKKDPSLHLYAVWLCANMCEKILHNGKLNHITYWFNKYCICN